MDLTPHMTEIGSIWGTKTMVLVLALDRTGKCPHRSISPSKMNFDYQSTQRHYLLTTSTPVKITSPMSWVDIIIRIFTQSRFEHAAILFCDYDNEWYVSESLGKGVWVERLYNFIKNNADRRRTYYVAKPVQFFPEKMRTIWGNRYDFSIFWRMVGFMVSRKLFGDESKITRFFSTEKRDNRYFCFEYAGLVFGLSNPHLLTGRDLDSIFEFEEVLF